MTANKILVYVLAALLSSFLWMGTSYGQYPQVQSVTETITSSGTTHDIDLPATINPGDLLIAIGALTTSVASDPMDWANIDTWGSSSRRLFMKISDGTEGGGVVTWTTGSSGIARFQVYRITNWYGSEDDVEVESNNENVSNHDPVSNTPTWGALDTLWIASYATATNSTNSGYPANYTNGVSTGLGGTGGVASAWRQLNATSEDPGAFTNTTSNAIVWTIAIRPSDVEPTSRRMWLIQ